ncbi:hypothetical protein ACQCT6_07615 [Cytobacillus gottheilii]|uniref:hypothetical protein n=1 Tax=Cytobacillus gottheilii TaxID=859144 RepID=UPI003CECFF68
MVNIKAGTLMIDQVSKSSGVFTGNNIEIGFSSSIQRNEGHGIISGSHNVLIKNKHVIVKHENEDK